MIDTVTPNEWDDYATGWDSNDDVQTYAEKAFDSWARNVAPLLSGLFKSRVLDFGCGTGLLTEKLAPLCGHIVAVDISEKMIDVLRSKLIEAGTNNVTALQIAINASTIEACPELSGKFDLIVASSVCSFLPDYEATLGNLSSVMNAGGCFVQWDWLADMPAERIQGAFAASGLIAHGVEEVFAMESEGKSMPVVMGIGRKQA